MAGLARVPTRLLFVELRLLDTQWDDLEIAAATLAALPFGIADVHGTTFDELAAVARVADRQTALRLVVVDGLGAPDRQYLLKLEGLAEELDVPVLAVTTAHETGLAPKVRDEDIPISDALRSRSLLLELQEDLVEPKRSPQPDARRLRLSLRRCQDDGAEHIHLSILRSCRWIEPASGPELSPAE